MAYDYYFSSNCSLGSNLPYFISRSPFFSSLSSSIDFALDESHRYVYGVRYDELDMDDDEFVDEESFVSGAVCSLLFDIKEVI